MCERAIFLNDLTIEEFAEKFEEFPDNTWYDEISPADRYMFESILYILGEWSPEDQIPGDRDPYYFEWYDSDAFTVLQIIKAGGTEKHIREYLEYYINSLKYLEFIKTEQLFKVRISECCEIAHKLSQLADIPDIFQHLDDIHITPFAENAIRRSIKWDIPDLVEWCKRKISDPKAKITKYRKGNSWDLLWDISIDGWVIEIWNSDHLIRRIRKV
jgi:hypothetical protein